MKLKRCTCGRPVMLTIYTFIGTQVGRKAKLKLHNCPHCKTTIVAEKIILKEAA